MTRSSLSERVRQWLWHEPSQRTGARREQRAGEIYRAYAFPGSRGVADLILPALMEQPRHLPEGYAPMPPRRVGPGGRPGGASYDVGLQVARP